MASAPGNASVGSSGELRVAILGVLILGHPLPPQGSDIASLGKGRGKLMGRGSGEALASPLSQIRGLSEQPSTHMIP
mgnify:CR=1 FL=1|jgi:hypothetical protein